MREDNKYSDRVETEEEGRRAENSDLGTLIFPNHGMINIFYNLKAFGICFYNAPAFNCREL